MSHDAIPQPKAFPVLGNILQLDVVAPVQSLMRIAKTYGPIVRLDFPSQTVLLLSSQVLVNEVCDESRFDKRVHAVLRQIRDFSGDGLFTAETHEPNWGKAHRILMPAFGPLGVRKMFGGMLDIADQLLLRWERFGESALIDVADQMTRLTLDTIALCAFDYRFNSFYQNEMHPFIDAMIGVLRESGLRTRRPELVSRAMLGSTRRYAADIRLLHEVADQLIAERRHDPDAGDKDDLLNRMLRVRDPVTGERLSAENVRNQMVTFLIAGHETTSGLLSFALYLLLADPRVLEKARRVVDEVLGDGTPTPEHLPLLRYLEQVLNETLRLWPTAPAFALQSRADSTLLAGRYPITRTEALFVLAPALHRDPAVWGPDAETFRPERFDREAEARLPPNAWKPFGNGQRACIGRPFAMQEALLVLALILQRFDILAADPGYELKIKETLTLKPEGFRIRVKRRSRSPFRPRSMLPSAPQKPIAIAIAGAGSVRSERASTTLLVLFGSNTGSSEAFAQRIVSAAATHGFNARIAALDDYAARLPKDAAVVIVTASYEGHPPDNARQFVSALDTLRAGDFSGGKFAVFGCGNRQWARTYQSIPTRIDAALAAAGGTRFKARGEADASGDFFGAFDEWYATLWPDLARALGKEAAAADELTAVAVEVVTSGRVALLRQEDLSVGELVDNRELVDMTSPLGRSKRHLEFALPAGMTYRAGDYLAILPRNPLENIERTVRRFDFTLDTHVVLRKRADSLTTLPTQYPIALSELLSDYVELSQPATRAQLKDLAAATRCPPDKSALEALADETSYTLEIFNKRVSVLDLLERFPACEISFERFLSMLPPLKPRQYSISSSPLWNAQRCTLTIAVVDAPAASGQGRFRGVASTFLGSMSKGTRVTIAVRPSNPKFHVPEDLQTPMVLICAGSGFAPFRGFLQERAHQAQVGRSVAKSLLFFGCDHPDVDYLYRDELLAWERAGVVDVRMAFSAAPLDGAAFVQERVWQDRADIEQLFRQGAIVYVCGDGQRMAPAVRDALARIYAAAIEVSLEEALRLVEQVERERGRFVEDVFA